MDHHLGYTQYEYKGRHSGNNRNGYSTKIPKGNHGSIEIETLYAKGMSTRDISDAFQDMYGVDIFAGLISKITNNVMERVLEWQNRLLDAVYPIVYLDCIILKKFWLSVLTELQNRGIEQILIAYMDVLSSFPDAINKAFPDAQGTTVYYPHA